MTVTTGDEKAVLSGLDRAIEKFNSRYFMRKKHTQLGNKYFFTVSL